MSHKMYNDNAKFQVFNPSVLNQWDSRHRSSFLFLYAWITCQHKVTIKLQDHRVWQLLLRIYVYSRWKKPKKEVQKPNQTFYSNGTGKKYYSKRPRYQYNKPRLAEKWSILFQYPHIYLKLVRKDFKTAWSQ